MINPAMHTRRAILKAFKRLNIEHKTLVQHADESCMLEWQNPLGWPCLIQVDVDGTANGTFPPELFALFCPEV